MLLVASITACGSDVDDRHTSAVQPPPPTTDHRAGGEPQRAAPGRDVVIELAGTHQTIDGFGVSARVWSDPHLTGAPGRQVPAKARSEILRLLYGDIGLTRQRSVLDPGMEPVNDDDDPGRTDLSGFDFQGKLSDAHIDLVDEARAAGLTTFSAAPVVLEEWMRPDETAEYVEWAITLLRHWRDLGAEPPYFSPVNEPALRAGRSAEWLRDVVRDLGRQLDDEGFRTRLVIPDDLNPTESLARAEVVLGDPEARPYVGALGYHLYGGDASDEAALAALARQYDLPLWMTEYAPGGASSWPGALQWAGQMQRLLTESDVSAIDYMWGFFGSQDDNALIGLRFDGDRYDGYDVRPMFDAVGQFSAAIRPGAVRVDARWDSGGSVSAFTGPGDQLVIVLVNPHNESRSVEVQVVDGILSGPMSATHSAVDARRDPIDVVASSSTSLTLELAPESVTTVVADLDG